METTASPEPSTISVPVLATPDAAQKIDAFYGTIAGRVFESVPTDIEDHDNLDSINDFVSKGGRLPGIDYNKQEAGAREEGFAEARDFLNESHFSVVNGVELCRESEYANEYHHPNPNDPDEKFGGLYALHVDEVPAVMETAEDCRTNYEDDWDGWENVENRIAVTDRALASIYKDRHVLAGLLALSGGKSGDECYRDMQEFFDFANNYRLFREALALKQMELRSDGDTSWAIRPLDELVGIWQPFNFPCIGFGDSIAALLAGDTIVVHTSSKAAGPYLWFFQKLIDAGVPASRMHIIIPDGNPDDDSKIDPAMSKALAADPRLGTIVSTGSYGVAQQLAETQAQKGRDAMRLDVKLHAESGGYNPMLITGLPDGAMDPLSDLFKSGMPSEQGWDQFFTDLPKDSFLASFKEGIVDSCCGLQGHKCSAISELILAVGGDDGMDREVSDMLTSFVVETFNRVVVDDVTKNPDADMGALIDAAAHKKIWEQMEVILARGGKILTGDCTLEERMRIPGHPNAMKPIVYTDPNRPDEDEFDIEIFGPVFRVHEETGKADAIERARIIPFALTSAIISETTDEALEIRDELPHGIGYVNGERTAPTTTAAPAPQKPFGGSKASGTGTGLLRPGTASHPLLFGDPYPRANLAKQEWKEGKGVDPTPDALAAMMMFKGIREIRDVTKAAATAV